MRLPIQKLRTRAVENGFAKWRDHRKKGVRGTSNRRLASFELKDLVQLYNSKIRGVLQYYSFINSKSDLWEIIDIYRKSCALTIADKLKLKTSAKVFAKYGRYLKIKNESGKVVAKLD